jgi:uncharacterized damage-inducible protein DinB
MMTTKKLICLLVFCGALNLIHGQYTIEPAEGYTPQIGIMVDMLEDLKDRITEQVKDLDQEQTDFLFDEDANSIGALIMHLISNESYYQVETLEGRNWNPEEAEFFMAAGGLGPEAREKHRGKPIKYYLDLWDAIRAKTLAGLKTKDDAWFAAEVDEGVNNHWVWFHVMEHSANHMGQIALVKNRLPE